MCGSDSSGESEGRLPRDGPGFDSLLERCIHRASRPSQGTVNGGAVSKWPRCWRDVKHKQTEGWVWIGYYDDCSSQILIQNPQTSACVLTLICRQVHVYSLWSAGPCRVGSVGSVSASRTVGREFASRPGHTKDHHKNGTNCLPA